MKRFWAWAIPVLVVVGIAAFGGMFYVAKSAVVGEVRTIIRAEVRPIERKVDVMGERIRIQGLQIVDLKKKME